MKKLSKQVLALGLASGVLLSGLPLGNVVDAASSKSVGKAKVTTVAKAELTTKQKVAALEKTLSSLNTAYVSTVKTIWKKQSKSRDTLAYLSEFRFNETKGSVQALQKTYKGLDAELTRLDVLYERTVYVDAKSYGKLTDAKKVVELTKRIEAVTALNKGGAFAKLNGKTDRLVTDTKVLEAVSLKLKTNERVAFELQKLPETVLLTKNEAWMKNIPLDRVTEKFTADLIGSGKSAVGAKVAAKELTDTLVAKGLREKVAIDRAKTVYVDSFKRSLREIGTGNHTVSDLKKLNGEYLDVQQEMSGLVSLAYKKHGLKPVIGAFLLK